MDFYDFFYALPSFLATIANLFLAIFVYHRNKKAKVNRAFAILSLCLASWNFGVFSWYLPLSPEIIDIWSRIFRTGLLFIPPTALYFSLIFTNTLDNKINKLGLYISYAFSVCFSCLNWTPWFVSGITQNAWGYSPQANWGYYLFIIEFIFFMAWVLNILYWKYRTTSSVLLASRIKYFFAGALIAVLLGSINFLTMLGIRVYPIGNLANVFYVGLVAYAIIKYHLLGIDVIIEKGIIYATLTLFISGIYGMVVGITQWLFSTTLEFTSLLGNIIAAMIIAISFHPLKDIACKITDKFFFKKEYEPEKILREFSTTLNSTVGLIRILKLTLNTLISELSIDKGSIMLKDDTGKFKIWVAKGLKKSSIKDIEFTEDDYLIRQLIRNPKVYLREETDSAVRSARVEGEQIRMSDEKIESLGATVSIPLFRKKKLIGVIHLGNKLSGGIFTHQDIELFITIANQASIAIENAKLYEDMMSMQRELYQKDKLTTLGTMTSEVVHEIKNPLTSINTFIQILAENFHDEECREKFFAIVPKELDRLNNILRRFSETTKFSTTPVFSAVDIKQVIEDILLLKDNDFSKLGVNIHREYQSDIPDVLADEGQLKQVFLNLIINALEAMPYGGMLKVSVQKEDSWVKVIIKDTGWGIHKEKIKDVFKPFFTTKEGGTGLGLSISSKIIKQHKGDISVESEEGKGTSFIIKLPVYSEAEMFPVAK